MKNIILSSFFFCALVYSFLEYRTLSLVGEVEKLSAIIKGEMPVYHGEENGLVEEAFLRKAEELKHLSLFHDQALLRSVEISLLEAENVSEETICNALATLRKAERVSPLDPAPKILLAQALSILSSNEIACDNMPTMNPGEYLESAITLAPFNTVNLYNASLSYSKLGNKTRALELLKQTQELDPGFLEGQKKFVYALVVSGEELSAAIPRTYPEIISWARFFYEQRESDYFEHEEIFSSAMHEAVSELNERFKAGKISQALFSSYVKELAALPIALNDETLRKRFDSILKVMYQMEGEEEWGKWLEERATLSRIPTLKSFLSDDLLPHETMLSSWFEDTDKREAYFDKLGQSIGLFVSDAWQAKYILLQSNEPVPGDNDLKIQVLVSNDNLNFQAPSSEPEIAMFAVDGNRQVKIDVANLRYRYFKIHYGGTKQDPHFKNDLSVIVQVYGTKLAS